MVSFEFLVGLRNLATKYQVALVYNETASQFYRFSENNFFASCTKEIAPDAGLLYLSGQSGLAFASDDYYLEQPLMMISTWDGDEFSFNNYYHSFKMILDNREDYKQTVNLFHKKLTHELSHHEINTVKISNGFGFFKGPIPNSMSKMFVFHGDRYIVCPSYYSMKEYLST